MMVEMRDSRVCIITAILKADFINSSDQDIYIVGDYNCDLNRGKRFDHIFSKFFQKNFLFDAAKN